MKKIIVLLIAVISFSAVSAQRGNGMRRANDRDVTVNVRVDDDHNGRGYSSGRAYHGRDHRYNGRDRHRGYDHRNRQYDRRIHDHRNYRSYDNYNRNRRIHHAEIHRQQRSNAFGSGVAVGAVAGAVLGAIIAR